MRSAVCMIVRNEASLVLEWIAYHLLIGFDACLIYDNGSTDGTAALARHAAECADVRVVDWGATDPRYQLDAYDDALTRFATDFDWIAFVDSDEFIYSPTLASIRDTLESFLVTAALVMNWAMFGSSGHLARPEGLTIARYLRRAENSFGPNRHTKMLVRTGCGAKAVNPHAFTVKGRVLRVSGVEPDWMSEGLTDDVVMSPWRVNHYFTRSREDWDAKLRRGYHDIVRRAEEFDDYDRNEVSDDGMLRHADALGQAVERLRR